MTTALQRRPGRGRHLPGDHLAQLHGRRRCRSWPASSRRRTSTLTTSDARPARRPRPVSSTPATPTPAPTASTPAAGHHHSGGGRVTPATTPAAPKVATGGGTGGAARAAEPAAEAAPATAPPCAAVPAPVAPRRAAGTWRTAVAARRSGGAAPAAPSSAGGAPAPAGSTAARAHGTRHEPAAGDTEPPRQLDRLGDPDPPIDAHRRVAPPGGPAEITTGPRARSAPLSESAMPSAWVSLPGPEQRLRSRAGSACPGARPSASMPSTRLERPDQDGGADARRLADGVEHRVDAVGAVHVRPARRAEQRLGPRRQADERVAGRLGVVVGLGLDDHP